MENVIHRLTLDLVGADTVPRVEVQQDNARSLSISLTQGGRPYWIAEGVTAVFSGRKPDGKPLFNGCVIEKNRVVYEFTDQTTNVAGIVECEILLYSGDERLLASPRFELAIDELIHKDGDVPESAPEINALTQMVAAGTAMLEDLREALAGLGNVEEILAQATGAAIAAAQSAENANAHALRAGAVALGASESAARAAASAQSAQVDSEQTWLWKEAAATSANDARTQAETAENHARNATEDAARAVAAAQQAEETAAGIAGIAGNSILTHNVDRYAHDDIRQMILALGDRLSAVLNSDDIDLDQLAEIVAYIKSNRTLIDVITTSKVSVADIVDNLTTNVANKPLSAAMGVALTGELDSLRASKLDASELTAAINTALTEAKASGEFDGADGISPTVEVSAITGGHRITISDALGTKTFDVEDGAPGEDGRGIWSITRTVGDGSPGTVDIYTIKYTDNTTKQLSVRNGANGVTPHIGTNGNWYIGTDDTGVKAQGPAGDPGPAYELTPADKAAITAAVIEGLPRWTGGAY